MPTDAAEAMIVDPQGVGVTTVMALSTVWGWPMQSPTFNIRTSEAHLERWRPFEIDEAVLYDAAATDDDARPIQVWKLQVPVGHCDKCGAMCAICAVFVPDNGTT